MSKLNIVITADAKQFDKSMKHVRASLKNLAKDMQSFGKSMNFSGLFGLSKVGVAVAAAKKIQDAYKAIQVGTGATGTALKKLQEDFRKIAVSGPQSFQESATAVADLHTRLGLSGEPLRKMSQTMLDLTRLTGGELKGNITAVTQAMNVWGVSAQSGGKFVNDLYVIAQSTGDSVSHLSDVLAANSGTMMALGMTYEEGAAAIGLLEKSGLRSEKAMKTLKSVLNSMLKAGVKDTSAGFQNFIERVRNASTETEAARLAMAYCGNEGATFARAIRTGAFNVSELTAKLGQMSGQMNKDADQTKTFGEKWSQMMNQVGMAMQPLGEAFISIIETFGTPVIRMFTNTSGIVMKLIAGFGALSVAIGSGSIIASYFTQKFANLAPIVGSVVLALSKMNAVIATLGTTSSSLHIIDKLVALMGILKANILGVATALMSPMGLIVAATAAIGILGYLGYSKSAKQAREETEKLQKAVDDFTDGLKGLSLDEMNAQLEIQRQKVADLTTEYNRLRTAALEAVKPTNIHEESLAHVGMAVNTSNTGLLIQADKVKTDRDSAQAQLDAGTKVRDEKKVIDDAQKKAKADAERALATARSQSKSSSKSTGKSAVERRIEQMQDAIKYLGADPASFQGELAKMYAKMPSTLTGDKKKIIDMQREIANKQKESVQKQWDAMKWQNSAGFLSDTQYAASLKDRLADLTGGQGFGAWSEEARGVFDELQRVMSEQLAPSLDSLKERFANGQITLGEYQTQLESLKQSYESYPAITKELQKELDAAKKSSHTFLSGMTAAIKDAKNSFDNLSVTVGTGLADGFARAIAYGEDLGETLKKLGQDIIYTVTKMLILQSVTRMFSGLFGGSSNPLALKMDGLDAVSGRAKGDAFCPSGVIPFARGGIVGRPTLFKFAGGTGLMGEAGPEAIMPLERDSHGRLGVVASGAGGGVYAPVINVNVENNGSGEMNEQQANQLSRQVRDVVDARIADQLSTYKRRGFFRGGAYT